jgi:hypothetical protein
MSIPVIVLLSVLAVAVLVSILVRFGLSSTELLDLDRRTRAAARLAAEEEDMQQLLEITNRRRRLAGLDEVTERELRDAAGG